MPYFDSYARLEPTAPVGDLDDGFAARIADPVWFLTRQWQLGELRGEDAGSPVLVRYEVTLEPLTDPHGRDAQTTPTEALVEAAPLQWWTPGRRLRVGHQLVDRAATERPDLRARLDDPALQARDLPPPYDFFNGTAPDGLSLFLARAELGLPDAWLANLPDEAVAPPPDAWDPRRFAYAAHLDAGPVRLDLDHAGGPVHWYSGDATAGSAVPRPVTEGATALPVRMSYRGAPAARWWELEARAFDVGGFPPDRSHFATLLLIDMVSSHSDDWFLFPVDTPGTRVGQLVTLTSIHVHDSFGDTFSLVVPRDEWTLFSVDGPQGRPTPLGRWSLPMFPRAPAPLAGPALHEVDLNIDDDANLLWAAERRIHGVETTDALPEGSTLLDPGFRADVSEGVPQRYDPTTPLRPHWHPYTLHQPLAFERHVEPVGPVRDRYRDDDVP